MKTNFVLLLALTLAQAVPAFAKTVDPDYLKDWNPYIQCQVDVATLTSGHELLKQNYYPGPSDQSYVKVPLQSEGLNVKTGTATIPLGKGETLEIELMAQAILFTGEKTPLVSFNGNYTIVDQQGDGSISVLRYDNVPDSSNSEGPDSGRAVFMGQEDNPTLRQIEITKYMPTHANNRAVGNDLADDGLVAVGTPAVYGVTCIFQNKADRQ